MTEQTNEYGGDFVCVPDYTWLVTILLLVFLVMPDDCSKMEHCAIYSANITIPVCVYALENGNCMGFGDDKFPHIEAVKW